MSTIAVEFVLISVVNIPITIMSPYNECTADPSGPANRKTL
ncbi:uncharacterized protein METZ01_LOCUS61683 [marine metagenome]|uniref:Uncharacterized protein n=1 Tax=marine metagenome TaxID=408172 RepID=A0A381SZD2_9ZZZZ